MMLLSEYLDKKAVRLTVKPLCGGKYAVMSGHIEIEYCDTRAQAIEVRAACPSDYIADFERIVAPLNPPDE